MTYLRGMLVLVLTALVARWVDVSVATLWTQPGAARAVDAPSLADPADPRAWVDAMTVAQKRWLVGRTETQATYGTQVYLLGTSGSWSRVAVPSQPSPKNRWGYLGWVPTRQLARTPPVDTPRVAVVRRPTAWLWETADLSGRVMELSYGTRLRAAAWSAASVEVVLPDGRRCYLRRSVVALHEPGTPWPRLTGWRLVTEAKRFLRLPYLWAGTSGFGFDCSGLVYTVHRALGRTIPRDAGPQSTRGARVASRAKLRRGDLVFFRGASGAIHHVGMYVGDGRFLHAPRTGARVQITSLSSWPYSAEFAFGRRFAK